VSTYEERRVDRGGFERLVTATGAKIPTLFQLLDHLGGNVSEQRRAEMSTRYPQKR
jgi:hypothetical protein